MEMSKQQMEASRPKPQADFNKSKQQVETIRSKKNNQDQRLNQSHAGKSKLNNGSHRSRGDRSEPFDLNLRLQGIANTCDHTDVINLLTIRGLDGKKLGPLMRESKGLIHK